MSLDRIPPDNSEHDEYDEFRDQYDESEPTGGGKRKGGAGRTFLTIVGIIGAIVVLAVIGLVIYFFISRGQLTNQFGQFSETEAVINAENTKTAMEATQTSVQELSQMTQKAILPPTWTPTKLVTTASAPSATPKPTNTTAPTSTVDPDQARTATVVAFLTQSARGSSGTQIAQITATATRGTTQGARTPTSTLSRSATTFRTPTALPTTGFADDVGLPGMLGLAVALIIIVFFSRRLRLSSHQ